MKPLFGNAATSAPNAAFLTPTRRFVAATVSPTTSSAQNAYTAIDAGSISRANGMLEPKRNNMHGSAKYSTYALSPGTAASGSNLERAAR